MQWARWGGNEMASLFFSLAAMGCRASVSAKRAIYLKEDIEFGMLFLFLALGIRAASFRGLGPVHARLDGTLLNTKALGIAPVDPLADAHTKYMECYRLLTEHDESTDPSMTDEADCNHVLMQCATADRINKARNSVPCRNFPPAVCLASDWWLNDLIDSMEGETDEHTHSARPT